MNILLQNNIAKTNHEISLKVSFFKEPQTDGTELNSIQKYQGKLKSRENLMQLKLRFNF